MTQEWFQMIRFLLARVSKTYLKILIGFVRPEREKGAITSSFLLSYFYAL